MILESNNWEKLIPNSAETLEAQKLSPILALQLTPGGIAYWLFQIS